MDEFWAVLQIELDRHGAKKELSDYLGVHAKSTYAWVNGIKTPNQERVNQMARWLRRQLSTPAEPRTE